MEQEFVTLPIEVVEQAQMWIPLLAEIAGLDPETTTAEFSEFADGRPASEFTIANVITALRAALDRPQNHVPDAGNMVPAGWKLVPVEPTKEMEAAAETDYEQFNGGYFPDWLSAYRAMLAAAPQPPALDQPQTNQPAMTPIAQRKLDDLVAGGYTISGYSVYHEQKHQHGFVTGAGLVGWWKPEGVEYPQPKREPLENEQSRRIYDSATYAASLAVFMTRVDAEHPDADDKGVSGWLQEAEYRVKRRITEADHNIK